MSVKLEILKIAKDTNRYLKKFINRQKKSKNLDIREFEYLFNMNVLTITKPIRLLGLGFKINREEETPQIDIFNR